MRSDSLAEQMGRVGILASLLVGVHLGYRLGVLAFLLVQLQLKSPSSKSKFTSAAPRWTWPWTRGTWAESVGGHLVQLQLKSTSPHCRTYTKVSFQKCSKNWVKRSCLHWHDSTEAEQAQMVLSQGTKFCCLGRRTDDCSRSPLVSCRISRLAQPTPLRLIAAKDIIFMEVQPMCTNCFTKRWI